MRVKAFSLMELIVVILLLGIIFSLGLSIFSSKKQIFDNSDIKNLPQYIQKIGLKKDAILYIYGDKCEKSSLISKNRIYDDGTVFKFDKSYKVYKEDNTGELKSFVYLPEMLDKKEQHVCLEINFIKGRFVDKLLVDTSGGYLLFSPFYQEVKSFDSLQSAKKAYLQDDIIPKSIDDYYR